MTVHGLYSPAEHPGDRMRDGQWMEQPNPQSSVDEGRINREGQLKLWSPKMEINKSELCNAD